MTEPINPVALAERILALFSEAKFSSTYKHAAMLGLIDLAFEKTTRTGLAPTSVTTRELAEQVLELYWPQCVPWQQTGVLRQSNGANEQGEILRTIINLRNMIEGRGAHTTLAARRMAPADFERTVRTIEWKLIEMPLPRLQRVGASEDRFLYEIGWKADIVRASVLAYQQGRTHAFDNTIRFKSGVAEALIALNGLLRPMIQQEWLRLLRRFNGHLDDRLETFLFERDRAAVSTVCNPLLELQQGRCFFCQQRVGSEPHVDHFVPWSRVPNNAVENLVVAHSKCNLAKLDYLAAADHVERWTEHVDRNSRALSHIGTQSTLGSAAERSLGIAAAIYLNVPTSTPLWLTGRQFEPANRERLRDVLRVA